MDSFTPTTPPPPKKKSNPINYSYQIFKEKKILFFMFLFNQDDEFKIRVFVKDTLQALTCTIILYATEIRDQ